MLCCCSMTAGEGGAAGSPLNLLFKKKSKQAMGQPVNPRGYQLRSSSLATRNQTQMYREVAFAPSLCCSVYTKGIALYMGLCIHTLWVEVAPHRLE